jgi:transcriptional regulator with XRE-family HTH domain
MDQATLADRVGLSKSSISRILSGVQEPKLTLANELAKALGVTLDYLMEESLEIGPTQHLVTVTDEELMILKIVRRLGSSVAIDRLLNVATQAHASEVRGTVSGVGARVRDSSRFSASSKWNDEEDEKGEPRDG